MSICQSATIHLPMAKHLRDVRQVRAVVQRITRHEAGTTENVLVKNEEHNNSVKRLTDGSSGH